MTRQEQIVSILKEFGREVIEAAEKKIVDTKKSAELPNAYTFARKIMELDAFAPGAKVMYAPEHAGCDMSKWEKGIVKAYGPEASKYFVVYNCGGDWDNYKNFTAALTSVSDLRLGWREVK